MKAAYLKNQAFATTSIELMLCEVFGAVNVQPLSLSDLRPSALKQTDLLILPGIAGEVSPYPQMLPPNKADMLLKTAEDHGMTIWTDCAATYWSAREISYLGSDGKKRGRSGLGWIDAVAAGPLPGKALAADKNFRYADTTTVAIEYYKGGETLRTDICYGNSPALYLNEDEARNPDIEILARFDETPDKPVAAMTKTLGHGMLVSLGVLPQIKPAHLIGRQQDFAAEKHRRDLFNAVARNENGIRDFENTLFAKIFARHPIIIPERQYA